MGDIEIDAVRRQASDLSVEDREKYFDWASDRIAGSEYSRRMGDRSPYLESLGVTGVGPNEGVLHEFKAKALRRLNCESGGSLTDRLSSDDLGPTATAEELFRTRSSQIFTTSETALFGTVNITEPLVLSPGSKTTEHSASAVGIAQTMELAEQILRKYMTQTPRENPVDSAAADTVHHNCVNELHDSLVKSGFMAPNRDASMTIEEKANAISQAFAKHNIGIGFMISALPNGVVFSPFLNEFRVEGRRDANAVIPEEMRSSFGNQIPRDIEVRRVTKETISYGEAVGRKANGGIYSSPTPAIMIFRSGTSEEIEPTVRNELGNIAASSILNRYDGLCLVSAIDGDRTHIDPKDSTKKLPIARRFTVLGLNEATSDMLMYEALKNPGALAVDRMITYMQGKVPQYRLTGFLAQDALVMLVNTPGVFEGHLDGETLARLQNNNGKFKGSDLTSLSNAIDGNDTLREQFKKMLTKRYSELLVPALKHLREYSGSDASTLKTFNAYD